MRLIFTIFTFVMMLGIIGGANYYIAKRIYQCISFFLPNTRFFIYIFLCCNDGHNDTRLCKFVSAF